MSIIASPRSVGDQFGNNPAQSCAMAPAGISVRGYRVSAACITSLAALAIVIVSVLIVTS